MRGIKYMLIAPYHPTTNSQLARYVPTSKRGLKALASKPDTTK